jgi:geranylgeranyl diphosphate synthase, type I
MHFTEYIAEKKAHTTTVLRSYLGKIKKDSSMITGYADAISNLEESLYDGKMVRAAMVFLGYEISGKKSSKDLVFAAAAIELFHAAFLTHDDIMDNDEKRRGKDTIYYRYQKIGTEKRVANPLLFGQSQGICIGDIAIFLGYDLLGQSTKDVSTLRSILSLVAKELQEVGIAQMMDVTFGQSNYEPTLDEILTIYRYKTARYTFSLPLLIGSMLADASKFTKNQVEKFGEALGIIFQIKDDELGIFGSENEIGKPVGSDIEENKKTVIRYFLMQLTKANIKHYFGKKVTLNTVEQIKKEIIDTGSQEEINKLISTYVKKSTNSLGKLKLSNNHKEIFEGLLHYNLKRNN